MSKFNVAEMRLMLKLAPVMILVLIIGLIIGIFFTAPPVGNTPVPEKTQLFDKPLKKGVENLIWQS